MEELRRALAWVQEAIRAIEADARRKADPAERTPLDYAVAVLVLLGVLALVLGSIALGWYVLWRTTLHRIGVFRDMLGLNRAAKMESKRRAEAEIRSLKSQLSQQHGFGGGSNSKED
ncbi:hypothetical protein HYH03_013138 [Edaphochlamys debaryana]|uniref:Uncharacterized protein n=1 Tax=Edaphochlamys debaryana TaxID=47281 RepID=A0A835XSQ1_9CHLO|nr:hypothetical protein HYH03_013138 [Edaphochlamys debaryana]|eukprot:KAG2488288.1 hypothetical protein HYH03_013138 [Edaphochlamys debaryana]